MDLGCGTSVAGNGAVDKPIPKDAAGLMHPLSMMEWSYQWVAGRRITTPNGTTLDYGYFPQGCPRYHRFTVLKPGNFTFDTCSSMMAAAVSILKRTDNLGESEPRMTHEWAGFKGGQTFSVPLHDNNQLYRNITTGLIWVQPDYGGIELAEWIMDPERADPKLPNLTASYPETFRTQSNNGCSLAEGANRT